MRVLQAGLMAFVALPMSSAMAQDNTPYLDDRTSAATLIKSLYNAINRKEYGRAWGYFSVPPVSNFATFENGFASTVNVEVLTGGAIGEGAAGATMYTLPVAIQAEDSAGRVQVFAGCYTLKLSNPQVQGEEFRPLSIERGALLPSNQELEAALPNSCDGVEIPKHDDALEQARAMFVGGRGDDCRLASDENDDPQIHTIKFRYQHDAEGDPERSARLIRFICDRGAYNERYAYYLAFDEDSTVKAVQFSMPELDIRYLDQEEAKLDSMNIIGFNAVSDLVNPEYDPATLTLKSASFWRGLGDASSVGTWIFRNGDFALVKFEVDPTYDNKVEMQTLIDYDTGP